MIVYFMFILFFGVVAVAIQTNTSFNNGVYLYSRKIQRSKKLYAFLIFVGLLLIYGLRDASVGVDVLQYKYIFFNADKPGVLPQFWEFKNDFGFYYFNLFFFKMGFNWQTYLIVVYAIVSFAIALYIYKFSNDLYFSLKQNNQN